MRSLMAAAAGAGSAISSALLGITVTSSRRTSCSPIYSSPPRAFRHFVKDAPVEPQLFVWLRRKPLLLGDVEVAFRTAARAIGLPDSPRARPTPHSLRHTFAVRALQACPDGRDAITRHMLALSTYLGHAKVSDTYWYLEAVPELMTDIADCCEGFVMGARR